MSNPIVYFVTGANRGIGKFSLVRLAVTKELVETKSNIHVFAGQRSSSKALDYLASKFSDKLTIVPFVAADEASNEAAAQLINDKFGYVDVVLGVAGISDYVGALEVTPVDVLSEHLRVNVIGVLVLFKAFAPLLKKSTLPKFIPLSSGMGSLTEYIGMPAHLGVYGASKAAMNYLTRKIHFENEWIVSFPLSPGMVETDMLTVNIEKDDTGTIASVKDAGAIKPDVAAKLLVGVIDSARRETHGGEYINIDGSKLAW